jgi:hypothetical protein
MDRGRVGEDRESKETDGCPLTELWKNRTQRTSCDQCQQQKMACHWDLVGVTSPQDLVAPKRSRKTVKKPVVTVDANEKVASRSLPSLAADIVSLSFALWNTAKVLVMESVAIQAMFIQFQDTLAGSLNRLMGFLVKEQAEAQEGHHAVLNLLQQLVQVVERAPSRQTETVWVAAVGNTEAGPSGAAVYTETVALDEVGLMRLKAVAVRRVVKMRTRRRMRKKKRPTR